jgi:SAM-dependent methyltransferase
MRSSTRTNPRPVRHPVFARCYARVGHLMDAEIGDHRRRLLAGLSGRVLEVGAGNGLNFPYYPATVTEGLAIEPEPYLRRLALAAARQAPVPIRVVAGTAEALPAPDGAVDAVVASLVLCTVADLDQALAETRRVLRPGGRLHCYEHVRATNPRLARWQDRLERPWGWLAGGCHPNRDTVAAITAAGLQVVQLDRFDLQAMPPLARPHVLGIAERRP